MIFILYIGLARVSYFLYSTVPVAIWMFFVTGIGKKKSFLAHADFGLHLSSFCLAGWTGEFACLLGCVVSYLAI